MEHSKSQSGRAGRSTGAGNSKRAGSVTAKPPAAGLQSPAPANCFAMKLEDLVTVCPGGTHALLGSFAGVRRIDLQTGAVAQLYPGPARVTCWGAVASPDQKFVAAGFGDLTLRVWDYATAKPLRQLAGHPDAIVTTQAFAADGRRLLTGAPDKTLRLWDVSTGKELAVVRCETAVTWKCALSGDAATALSCGTGPDRDVHVWDLATQAERAALSGHTARVNDVAISADGRLALSAGTDKLAIVWNLRKGAVAHKLAGHRKPVRCCALSPDGRLAITGSVDGTARVWDAASGAELARLEGHAKAVTSVALFDAGRRALTGCEDEKLRVWHLA